jgi:hypothetical protein
VAAGARPEHYAELIARADGISVVTDAAQAEMVHLSCRKESGLERLAEPALGRVRDGGTLDRPPSVRPV